jgi:endoglucanase
MRAAMDAATPIEHVFEFARIRRTTRAQYRAASGTENVEGAAWLRVVRQLYQQGRNSDRNELMIAWAKTNL